MATITKAYEKMARRSGALGTKWINGNPYDPQHAYKTKGEARKKAQFARDRGANARVFKEGRFWRVYIGNRV